MADESEGMTSREDIPEYEVAPREMAPQEPAMGNALETDEIQQPEEMQEERQPTPPIGDGIEEKKETEESAQNEDDVWKDEGTSPGWRYHRKHRR